MNRNWTEAANFFSGNIYFEFFVLCLCCALFLNLALFKQLSVFLIYLSLLAHYLFSFSFFYLRVGYN